MPDGNSPTEKVGQRLARGVEVTDDEVDALMPDWLRHLSKIHWTPVSVAQKAAQFLVGGDVAAAHILDVGSGAGKFCSVAAATTGARFTGIERRAALLPAAKVLARALDADGARFICGRMEALDWAAFTGVYLFNPFGEHFVQAAERIDNDDKADWAVFLHYVRSALARLYLMPEGTRVATYHGMGGPMPPGYDLVGFERCGTGILRFYVRVDPTLVEAGVRPRDLFDEGLLDEVTAEMPVPAGSRTEP